MIWVDDAVLIIESDDCTLEHDASLSFRALRVMEILGHYLRDAGALGEEVVIGRDVRFVHLVLEDYARILLIDGRSGFYLDLVVSA